MAAELFDSIEFNSIRFYGFNDICNINNYNGENNIKLRYKLELNQLITELEYNDQISKLMHPWKADNFSFQSIVAASNLVIVFKIGIKNEWQSKSTLKYINNMFERRKE